MNMDENIRAFEDEIGKCERILKTPVPFVFVLHLRTIIMVYCIVLPLYLMKDMGWGAVPITLVVGYGYTALEDLGQMIENPFREDWHALPIDGICTTIKGNLLELQAWNRARKQSKPSSG